MVDPLKIECPEHADDVKSCKEWRNTKVSQHFCPRIDGIVYFGVAPFFCSEKGVQSMAQLNEKELALLSSLRYCQELCANWIADSG